MHKKCNLSYTEHNTKISDRTEIKTDWHRRSDPSPSSEGNQQSKVGRKEVCNRWFYPGTVKQRKSKVNFGMTLLCIIDV